MLSRYRAYHLWWPLVKVADLAKTSAQVVSATLAIVLLGWFSLAPFAGAFEDEDTAGTKATQTTQDNKVTRKSQNTQNTFISFKIKDQFDHLHTDARYRGSVILVTWADRKGSDYMENWGPVLDDSLAAEIQGFRVRHVDVAHVKGVPFFLKGKIKGYFSKDPEEWVLMDWDGEFDKAYDCTEDHSNVFVFARDGKLSGRWAVTAPNPAALAEMLVLIRGLSAP